MAIVQDYVHLHAMVAVKEVVKRDAPEHAQEDARIAAKGVAVIAVVLA